MHIYYNIDSLKAISQINENKKPPYLQPKRATIIRWVCIFLQSQLQKGAIDISSLGNQVCINKIFTYTE